MGTELQALVKKVLAGVRSFRVMGVAGANIWAGISDLPPWPRATVLAVTVLALVASETALYWKGLKK